MDNNQQRIGESGIGDQGAEYADLIARLEKATGWDRQLDHAIALATGWTQSFSGATGTSPAGMRSPDGQYHYHAHLFTGSIDAALALLPPEWTLFEMGETHREGCGWYVTAMHKTAHIPEVSSSHTQFAIALCIAALRARAALSKAETGRTRLFTDGDVAGRSR